MIETVLLAVGLVLIVEGLAYVLAPSLVEQLLAALRDMPIPARRTLGLLALVIGAGLVVLARALGA